MRSANQSFVEALRAVLKLGPLYKEPEPEPWLREFAMGTHEHPAQLVAARVPTSVGAVHFTIRDHFARLDGKPVGRVFLQKPVLRKAR